MSCTFIKNQAGEITAVRNKNGKKSKLFEEALSFYGDRQEAINLVAVTQTQDFKDNVYYKGIEPSFEEVINYIKVSNQNPNVLSAIQSQDLKNSLMSLDMSAEDFRNKATQAFYKDNYFAPTLSNLVNSGIYSPYEARNIVSSIDLQETIKSSLEALNNTNFQEEDYVAYQDVLPGNLKTTEVNSFGKLNSENPYIVKNNLINALVGITDRQEFDDKLNTLVSYDIDADGLYQEVQKYVKAQYQTEENENEPTDNIKPAIELGVDVDFNPSVLPNLEVIINTPEAVLNLNAEQTRTVLESIEADLADSGLDVIGIKDNPDKNFLRSLKDFVFNPSSSNLNSFIESYNTFFGLNTENRSIPLKVSDKNRNYVYLETTQPEDRLYKERSLLKAGENTFIKVQKIPLEQLRQVVNSYETIDNPEQYSASLQQISDNDLAEEIYLMKRYFNVPINIKSTVNVVEQKQNTENFSGNFNYLTNGFLSDFQKEALKQKLKNSAQWNNFYKYFNINNKGLVLNQNDPITIENIKSWIEEIKPSIAKDLKQYSLISKQLPTFVETSESSELEGSRDGQRDLAVNYPLTVQKPNAETFKINNEVIIAKDGFQDFIRVGDDVYESIEQRSGLTMYVKLPKNETDYNTYKNKQPQTKESLKDYSYLEKSIENHIREKNTISSEQKEEIKNQNYNC